MASAGEESVAVYVRARAVGDCIRAGGVGCVRPAAARRRKSPPRNAESPLIEQLNLASFSGPRPQPANDPTAADI